MSDEKNVANDVKMQRWEKIGEDKFIHEGYMPVVRKNFKHPKLGTFSPEAAKSVGSKNVDIIPIAKDGMAVVGKQFRCGPEDFRYELAGGSVETGEDILEAGLRELKEELGYLAKPENVVFVGKVFPEPWGSYENHYFLAYDCEPCPKGQENDDVEIIEPIKVTIDELIDIAKKGLMSTPEGVFFALDKLNELKEKQNN